MVIKRTVNIIVYILLGVMMITTFYFYCNHLKEKDYANYSFNKYFSKAIYDMELITRYSKSISNRYNFYDLAENNLSMAAISFRFRNNEFDRNDYVSNNNLPNDLIHIAQIMQEQDLRIKYNKLYKVLLLHLIKIKRNPDDVNAIKDFEDFLSRYMMPIS